MNILGISAYYHDSAACIIRDGEIIAAAQEERFTRIKHDASFPAHAVRYCLDQSVLEMDELDAVVFYDKPLLKFERLLETYYAFAPKGVRSFIMSMPVWLKEKMFLKKTLRDELKKVGDYDKHKLTLLFPERHENLPEDYFNKPMMERLYVPRSDVQAITHVDMSARVQTVHKEINERYWRLIKTFKDLTGYGVIVNTSFNVRGEPIVCTPEDAYRCFMRTEMDYLVIGAFMFCKTEQPNWQESDSWKKTFKLD